MLAGDGKERTMNGYSDRVRRHQRELAEAAGKGERDAVPGMDWVADTCEGVAHALESVRVRRRKRDTDDAQDT
jgi:hypothetical protein